MAAGPLQGGRLEPEATRLLTEAPLSCFLAFTRRATSLSWVLVVRALTLSSVLLSNILIIPLSLLLSLATCLVLLFLVLVFAPWIVPTKKLSSKGKAMLGSTYAFSFDGLQVAWMMSLTQSCFQNLQPLPFLTARGGRSPSE